MDGLTEGRIVHFVTEHGRHLAAIVVKVWSKEHGTVNLTVFNDYAHDMEGNTMQQTSVNYSEDFQPNSWHWIEKA
jgi:hypothetical protein